MIYRYTYPKKQCKLYNYIKSKLLVIAKCTSSYTVIQVLIFCDLIMCCLAALS